MGFRPALTFLFLALCTLSAIGQSADSLLTVITNLSDVKRQIEQLDVFCRPYTRNYDASGKALFEKRMEIIRNSGDKEAEYERIYETGYYYFTSEQIDALKAFITPYHRRVSEVNAPRYQAPIHFLYGCLLEYERNNEEALMEIQKSISIWEHSTLEFNIPAYRKALLELGRVQHAVGDLNQSSVALNRALEAHLAVNDSLGAEDCLVELGILFSQIGLYDEAEDYFKARYELVKPKPLTLALDLINLGRNLLLQSRFEEAVIYYKKALDHGPFEGATGHYDLFAKNGLIEGLYFSGNTDSVSYFFEKMNQTFKGLGAPEHFSFLVRQSRFLSQLLEGNYTAARKDGMFLYESAIASGDVSDLILSARFLSELYRRSNDLDLALKFTDIYHLASDSLKSVQKANGLSLLQTQYETEKKEGEILKLETEKQLADAKIKQWSIAALLLLILLALGSFLYLQLSRARKQISLSNVALLNLNKTKDRFFGIIAHDLRNPIVALESVDRQMEFYLDKNDVPKLKRATHLVGKTARNLNRLLDNLLNWALSQTGGIPYHPKQINAKVIIDDAVQLFKGQAESKGIQLLADNDEEITCYVDPSALSTTIRNLLHNAIKYSKKGDSIRIQVRQLEDNLRFEIADTGQGMSDDVLQGLFALDKKSKAGTDGEKGTGLGLILCKELVELNKGTIEIISELGLGSTISFTVPQKIRSNLANV